MPFSMIRVRHGDYVAGNRAMTCDVIDQGTRPRHNLFVVPFFWFLGAGDAESLVCGTDIVAVAPDGRNERITGFLDKMPS